MRSGYAAEALGSFLAEYATRYQSGPNPDRISEVNGSKLTESQRRNLARWRAGEVECVDLGTADALLLHVDLTLADFELWATAHYGETTYFDSTVELVC